MCNAHCVDHQICHNPSEVDFKWTEMDCKPPARLSTTFALKPKGLRLVRESALGRREPLKGKLNGEKDKAKGSAGQSSSMACLYMSGNYGRVHTRAYTK